MENKVSNPNETNRSASNLATSSVEGSLETDMLRKAPKLDTTGQNFAASGTAPGAYILHLSQDEIHLREEIISHSGLQEDLERQMAAFLFAYTQGFQSNTVVDDVKDAPVHSGLVEAKPVTDDRGIFDIGVAMPAEDSDTREEQRTIWALLTLITVVIVVVLVVIVVLTADGNSRSGSKDIALGQPSPASAPSPHVVDLPDFTLQAMESPESPQPQAFVWLKADPMLAGY